MCYQKGEKSHELLRWACKWASLAPTTTNLCQANNDNNNKTNTESIGRREINVYLLKLLSLSLSIWDDDDYYERRGLEPTDKENEQLWI